MSDTIDEQAEREAFEAWITASRVFSINRTTGGCYIDLGTDAYWCGWLACARTKAAEIAELKREIKAWRFHNTQADARIAEQKPTTSEF